MLNEHMKAPEFTLKDQHGNDVSLSDFKGKKIVLYFYPKDNTSGCTKQACAFSALNSEIESKNAVIIGVSRDSSASHQKFAEKNGLNFLLLSDPGAEVTNLYGAWQEKTMCGKTSMGVVRTTVIIDENGEVEKVMSKVKAESNPADVNRYLG
ncbi:MAG: thioredoxin-dependent thiol peroxidase [Clostridia bacterium]|nr:thioredoxin-dependent thiol peroxidase [Clostridia bacterium]